MESLEKELAIRLKGARRVAVLGVGSELRGDDVAGILVSESIEKAVQRNRRKTINDKRKTKVRAVLRAFQGSTAPENLTGEIIAFKPTHIIIVDTADIGEEPGTVLLLRADEVGRGVSFSTHKIPPKVLIDYFVNSIECEIIIIGIQPKSIKFNSPASKTIKARAKSVASSILEALN